MRLHMYAHEPFNINLIDNFEWDRRLGMRMLPVASDVRRGVVDLYNALLSHPLLINLQLPRAHKPLH